MPASEIRVTLSASGIVNTQGKFEILAMTVGEGHGWIFGEAVLRESLDIWDGVECFVDHGGWFGGRKVKDLGGICRNPQWSEDNQGIKLELKTIGPLGDIVAELGRQILAEEEPKPKIGFSADVLFKAKGREVTNILRVLDLSLVFNPARGGAFVRVMNSINPRLITEVSTMPEEITTTTQATTQTGGETPPEGSEINDQLQTDLEAIQELQSRQEERDRLDAEAEDAREIRVGMCAYLLESGLTASKLPEAMRENVRKQFEGKVFTPAELDVAIEDARKLISELSGSGSVAGPQISSMFSTNDQLQAAVDDLLNARRDAGSEKLVPARLSGIKELYMMMTGDRNLYGGYYPQHIQLATTSNFAGLVKNALNKIVADTWEELGKAGYDWWNRVTTQEHFETLNTITGILVGTVGTLPVVAEGGEYTELKIGDSPETADFTKYGLQFLYRFLFHYTKLIGLMVVVFHSLLQYIYRSCVQYAELLEHPACLEFVFFLRMLRLEIYPEP